MERCGKSEKVAIFLSWIEKLAVWSCAFKKKVPQRSLYFLL